MSTGKHRPGKPSLETLETWRSVATTLLVQGALALALVALAIWGP